MNFGIRLKRARQDMKLTQSEVANKIGIDDTTISKYENNKSEPDNETLRKLSDLYGRSIDYFLGKKINPDPLENEKEFIEKIDLSDDELIKQFTIEVDGRPLSEKEMRKVIAQVRLDRQYE